MKRKFLNLVFLITFSGFLSAQSITNVQSKQEGNTIAVTYDLQCDGEATLGLFVSEDGGKNFTGPIVSISGDVGNGIKSGSDKKIIWDVTKDKEVLYGNNIIFRIKTIPLMFDTFTDPRDSKIYKTIKIGNQIWMAENLNYCTSSNSWCYYDNPSNCDKYGRLYDWQTAQNVCPNDWRLPSKSDFETLLTNVGGSGKISSNALKEGGNSGFSALLGGFYYRGNFNNIGKSSNWWSSSEGNTDLATSLQMQSKNASVGDPYGGKSLGFYVRCIKN